MKKLRVVLIILMALLFLCSLYFLGSYLWEEWTLHENEKVTDEIRTVVIPPEIPDDLETATEEERAYVTELQSIADGIDGEEEIDLNLLREVDFDELLSINSQATRWIYIPDTNIDYYVMQEKKVGTYKYLWLDINGKRNHMGSCLTPAIPGDEEDAHLLIFGHNLRYSASLMLSDLIKYRDADYFDTRPYVYLYHPGYSERYKVYAICDLTGTDMVYEVPYLLGSDDYATLLTHMADHVKQSRPELAPTEWDRTLMLSSCNRAIHRNGRNVLVCVPDLRYDYETKTLTYYETPKVSIDAEEVIEDGNLVHIRDSVNYIGLEPGIQYEVTGQLIDKATYQPVIDGNGDMVQCVVEFTPDVSDGSIDLTIDVDKSLCIGRELKLVKSGMRTILPEINHLEEDMDYDVFGSDGRTASP